MPPRKKRERTEEASPPAGAPVDAAAGTTADVEISGDLELECSSGGHISVMSQILKLASPVFKDMLTSEAPATLKVDGSKEAWRHLLRHLYPTYPRPELTLASTHLMLPVAHQYDMRCVLAEIKAFLPQQFPEHFSFEPKCPRYILTWLKLADDLQLEDVRALCMAKFRSMAIAKDKQLETALIANTPEELRTVSVSYAPPAAPRPQFCPDAGGSSSGHGSDCTIWCGSSGCRKWVCSRYPRMDGTCIYCRQALTTTARWLPSDKPKLQEDIKGLGRDTLEDLLASMVVVCLGECSAYEPAA